MKSTPLLFACMASLALARAIGERQNTPNTVQADSCDAQGVVSTKTNAATAATSQTQEEVEERVKEHCGRFRDDTEEKRVCNRSVQRCAAQVRPNTKVEEFLECVDKLQACFAFASYGDDDKCVAKAQQCREQHKLPLGELTKLNECLKIDFPPQKLLYFGPPGKSGKSAS